MVIGQAGDITGGSGDITAGIFSLFYDVTGRVSCRRTVALHTATTRIDQRLVATVGQSTGHSGMRRCARSSNQKDKYGMGFVVVADRCKMFAFCMLVSSVFASITGYR